MEYSPAQIAGIDIFFIILPILAVAGRIWAAVLSRRGFATSDYLLFVATACSTALCITQLIAVYRGSLGRRTPHTADGVPILDPVRLTIFQNCLFAAELLSPLSLGFTKASFLFFYLQIFGILKPFRILVYVVLGLVIAWTLSFFFADLFSCDPVAPVNLLANGHQKCVDIMPNYLANAGSDFIIDFFILAMPIPMVLRLQRPLAEKITISGMFLLGTLVCVASVTRFVEYVKVVRLFHQDPDDLAFIIRAAYVWSIISASLANVAACLPTYGPIWTFLSELSLRNGFGFRRNVRLSSKSSADTEASQRLSSAEVEGAVTKHGP